jgi:hypothetical protein
MACAGGLPDQAPSAIGEMSLVLRTSLFEQRARRVETAE